MCVDAEEDGAAGKIILSSPSKETDFVPIGVDSDRCCLVIDL